MSLEFRRFQKDYYPEYAAWFVDPELNRHLGPMDQDWLEAVQSENDSDGITWAVFRDGELVAVIETAFDPDGHHPATIAAIATKPSLRGQGIGTAVLKYILSLHHSQGIREHSTYVATDNDAARRFIEKVGFAPTAVDPDEHGYVEFRRR